MTTYFEFDVVLEKTVRVTSVYRVHAESFVEAQAKLLTIDEHDILRNGRRLGITEDGTWRYVEDKPHEGE